MAFRNVTPSAVSPVSSNSSRTAATPGFFSRLDPAVRQTKEAVAVVLTHGQNLVPSRFEQRRSSATPMSGSSLRHPILPPSGRDGLAGGRWLPYRPGTAARAAGQPADVSQLLGASRGRVDADQVITIRHVPSPGTPDPQYEPGLIALHGEHVHAGQVDQQVGARAPGRARGARRMIHVEAFHGATAWSLLILKASAPSSPTARRVLVQARPDKTTRGASRADLRAAAQKSGAKPSWPSTGRTSRRRSR